MISQEISIANRLLCLRKELKLSQSKFGKRLGITNTAISKLEKAERNLTEQMAKAICREFRVDYFWLTQGIGDMFLGTPEGLLDDIVREYNLDEIDKNIIEDYLKLDIESRNAVKTLYLKSKKEKRQN